MKHKPKVFFLLVGMGFCVFLILGLVFCFVFDIPTNKYGRALKYYEKMDKLYEVSGYEYNYDLGTKDIPLVVPVYDITKPKKITQKEGGE